jgi:hypothetical protein
MPSIAQIVILLLDLMIIIKLLRLICSKCSTNRFILLRSDEGHNDKNRSIVIDIIRGFICLVLLFLVK